MKPLSRTRSALLVAAASLFLGFLFVRSASVDPEIHHHFENDLQLAVSLDNRLNQDVLRARHGVLQHYDGIVADLASLNRLQARLQNLPDFLPRDARGAVAAAIADYDEHARAKSEFTEQFKTTNAALKNSFRYFPVAALELDRWAKSRSDAEEREHVRDLTESVLRYELIGEPAARAEAFAALERLESLRVQPTTTLADMPDGALVHARNIVERKPALDSLLSKILAIPTADSARRAAAIYKEHYAKVHQTSETYRRSLYFAAVVMIGWIGYAFSALRQAKIELEAMNEDLDQRVRRRTRELEDAKQMLEADARALEALNAELESSNRELDDFAYIASHDLKEPLRGIHNYAAFLIEDYADLIDEEGRRKLETLRKLAKRMDGLIDSLLYYSRVGRTELAVGAVQLQETVTEVVQSLEISLEQQGVEVRIPRELPTVTCDPVRIAEVYRNLVSNALKYNDKPEKWLEMGFLRPGDSEAPDDLGQMVFYARDNGIGIKEKNLESVFRIFKRLHGRDKYGGGTGSGLTIAKKIVERHGGRMWVESIYGEGTTFFFTLGGKTID